jgi:ADP-ribosylglycohydrolase
MFRDNKDALRFNRDKLRDKIHACWIGKNIGGILGLPIEGKRSICNITGFQTDTVLSNDDLDLQLVWLRAVDELGPEAIRAQTLGEYWLSYVGPSWNEYGICKMNMREGFLPPLSGAFSNDEWKHSNGAWIRTEIWACLSPGCPEQAARFAYEDATVDHGINEGTYAAVFIASLESVAFVVHDMKTLIEIGLSKIPADCRVAKSINIALEYFNQGRHWKEARDAVVMDSMDLGWLQAPANVAYTIIGLLYGEGDFKKTVLTAINCGDDTDCTGATAGAIMGILGGMNAVPEDWKETIKDSIKRECIVEGHGGWIDNCYELTECVMRLLPATTRTKVTKMIPDILPVADSRSDLPIIIWDDEDDLSSLDIERFYGSIFLEKMYKIAKRTPYILYQDNVFADVWVELDEEPRIASNGDLPGRISIALKRMPEQKWFRIKWYTPEGWSVTGDKNISTSTKDYIAWDDDSDGRLVSAEELFEYNISSGCFTIHAGDEVEAWNRILLEVSSIGRPSSIYIPVILLGKK